MHLLNTLHQIDGFVAINDINDLNFIKAVCYTQQNAYNINIM